MHGDIGRAIALRRQLVGCPGEIAVCVVEHFI